MRRSRFFMPTLKETPSEAQIASHRLMLRAGMVRQHAAGIYNWLPLGHRVLSNIEAIVAAEQDRAGAMRITMPTIQSADLWRESGRYDDYGPEMLRINDRHDRDMLYGPTHEEVVTDIFRNNVRSYRDLPLTMYQIHWKFRDEVRPRFGVMRGREFLMKDGYSFDVDFAASRHTYNQMFVSYLRTFAAMGLRAIPMAADSGPIGGDMSHEFIVLAETGESDVFCHRGLLEKAVPAAVDYDGDLQPIVDDFTSLYAATDEKRDTAAEQGLGDNLVEAKGVEVGHIFHFGTKYSAAMGAKVQGPDGEEVTPLMGSYGIGVSRLVGAIIEASHDDAGIIWPRSVAPFAVGLVNLKPADEATTAACEDLYGKLRTAGVEVLYDDRDERAGAKFAEMDLIGLPDQVVIGPKGAAAGVVEVKDRATGAREELSPDAALTRLLAANGAVGGAA